MFELLAAASAEDRKSVREEPIKVLADRLCYKEYMIVPEKMQGSIVHGLAQVFRANKLVFRGEYRNSRREGFGIEFNEDGEILYEGTYHNNMFSGWGRTRGGEYQGEFQNGLYNGYGILTQSNLYYEGFFRNGEFSGTGVLLKGEPLRNLSARHDKCIHDFVDEMIKDFEQVSQLYNIVEMYVGEFAGNEKHGFGRECKKEGWYSGQFSNGLKHGIGTEQGKGKGACETVYHLQKYLDKTSNDLRNEKKAK